MAPSKTGKKLETGGRYAPIGNSTNQFTAKFDGGGHEIKLTINVAKENGDAYAGVFGYVGEGGEICKLGVAEGSYISASILEHAYAGGIVGYVDGATIIGCYNAGTVKVSGNSNSNSDAGGIAGYASGAITGCYNTGKVSVTADGGDAFAGGIAGKVFGAISRCYNTGTVSGESTGLGSFAGGIAGEASGAISGCYNTGTVTASTGGVNGPAGGIVGVASGAISGCYNTGTVTASTGGVNGPAGGIVGVASGTTITGCYNTGEVKASGVSVSFAGGIVGWVENGTITVTGCYNIGTVSASASDGVGFAGGIVGGADGTINGCYYLKKDESDPDSKGAQKGVGNNTEAEVTGIYEGKSLADMQGEDFAQKLSQAVAKFEPQWEADTLESVKGLGIEVETLEEAANGLEEKLKAAETDKDKKAIQDLLNQVKQVIFVKNSRPENVDAFAFIAGRTPPIWWEKAEIDAALAEVDKVEGVLKKLQGNGVDTGEAEKKLNEIKEKIKITAPHELPGLVEEAKKEILPLALAAVEKIEDEVKLKGKEIDTSEAENSLDGIKEAIGEATTIEQVEEQVQKAQGVLADLKLRLAKAEALAAVKKIEAEVIKQGQLYDEDTSAAAEELEGIKTEIGAATTVDEVKKQVVAAQGVLAGFRTKLRDAAVNLGHARSGIGGQAGFYKASNGVVTFRVAPNPGYKISRIVTSGSRIIKPGSVVKTLPECVKVRFEKV